MNRVIRSILILLFLINNNFIAVSQDDTNPITNSSPKSLKEFIESEKLSSQYHFYVQTDKILEISIDSLINHIDSESISQLLKNAFKNTPYCFYFDNSNNFYLYEGKPIIEKIPNYTYSSKGTNENHLSDQGSTVSQKKYYAGRVQNEITLIQIGERQNANLGSGIILSGKIIDNTNGEPLVGATVYIEELNKGAASDLDGFFNIALPTGKYHLVANCIAMKEEKLYIEVNESGSITIPMEKELVSISEVRVTASKHHNVKGIQMGYDRISNKRIKEIPVVMGEKDLLKVAQMLPGVQSAGEGTSGLYVRGGNADQNLFYINKLPVYNTSHLFGFFTAFSPDVVSDFSLYKSNIPANFGGRVSSVFDISTRQGNKKSFYGKGGISPITGHFALEGPIVKDKSAFIVSYRGTYSDWLLSQMHDENLKNSKASFYDVSAGINTEINSKNLVKIFGYASNDRFSLSTTDDYDYYNNGAVINFKHYFKPALSADFIFTHSQYGFGHNDKSNLNEAYRHEYKLSHTEVKTDFLFLSSRNHRLLFGGSGIIYNLNRGSIRPYSDSSNYNNIDLGKEKAVEGAIYFSDEFALHPRLTLLIGLRYSFYSLLGPTQVNTYIPESPINKGNIQSVQSFANNEIVKSYGGPEPRFAINYRLTENSSVKASYNRLRQYIFMLSNTIAISPTDQWKLSDNYLKPPIFDQFSIGYYLNFPEKGIETSIEGYKKWGKNLVEYRDGANFISADPIETQLLQGNQDSYGYEFILKKNNGKMSGWLSYSYSRSIMQVANNIQSEQINYGNPYPSNFDRPHSFNLVTTVRSNRRLSFSTNVVYSTGRPISYPVASYITEGVEVLHYSERNKYRIPDYFRVDLSINLEGNLNKKKWLHSYWMFNIYNLTGRRNAYSVYFENQDGKIQGYKLSVFGQPVVTLSWSFKFGNYVSE